MKKVQTVRLPFSLSDALSIICLKWLNYRRMECYARRGEKIVVYANDLIGNVINCNGLYEYKKLQTIFHFLSPVEDIFSKCIALDIGANIGNHSIFFSRYFSEVHAFEPHPITAKILAINGLIYPRIVTHDYGLSDRAGYLPLVESLFNLGGSRIDTSASNTVLVPVKRLDDLDFHQMPIGLIKLDVEGHEACVLRGGLNTIRQHMPIVLFEAYKQDFSDPMNHISILRDLGYHFAWIRTIQSYWRKYASFCWMVIKGRQKSYIFTGKSIPITDHFMIVAVLPRWLSALQMV